MATLYELTTSYEELLFKAQTENLEYEVLRDTLEALEGDIEYKADGYAKIIRQLEGDVELLKNEIDRLNKRKKSIETNISNMKKAIENAMKLMDKKSFKTKLFSFNLQKNPPKVVIDDYENVNKDFLVQQDPKIDTKALRDYLKDNEVDWARLEQSESLRIR